MTGAAGSGAGLFAPVVGVVALVAVVLVLVRLVRTRTSLLELRAVVDEAWQQVAEELQRRVELVPDLLAAVGRHGAGGSGGVWADAVGAVASARDAVAGLAGSGPGPVRAAAEDQLSARLDLLFAALEPEPALRGDESYLALQHELAGTEDRIAAGRRFFDAAAATYNDRLRSPSGRVVAAVRTLRPVPLMRVPAAVAAARPAAPRSR